MWTRSIRSRDGIVRLRFAPIILFLQPETGENAFATSARRAGPMLDTMKRVWVASLIGAACAVASVVASHGSGGAATVIVPHGEAITLDGVMGPDEWSDADRVRIADGAWLYLKKADGFLFLGVATPEPVVGNVLIQTGSDVLVLHSSAALGTAVYAKEEDLWRRTRDFRWRCRGRTLTERVREERETFLREEGWLASITYQGAGNHLEIQIAAPTGDVRLMLVLLPAARPSALFTWPDDVVQDLFPGPIPAEGHFDPREWPILTLSEEESKE